MINQHIAWTRKRNQLNILSQMPCCEHNKAQHFYRISRKFSILLALTLDRKSQKFISLLLESMKRILNAGRKKESGKVKRRKYFFIMWTQCGGSNKLLNEFFRLHRAADRIACRGQFLMTEKRFLFITQKKVRLNIEQLDFFSVLWSFRATLCSATSIALSSFGSGQCSRGSLAFFCVFLMATLLR